MSFQIETSNLLLAFHKISRNISTKELTSVWYLYSNFIVKKTIIIAACSYFFCSLLFSFQFVIPIICFLILILLFLIIMALFADVLI